MPDLDAVALIRKHRGRGVLVDTNLMVLYLVGHVNRQRILTFKRTQNFTLADFNLLDGLISQFGNLVATPHVLAQVSDLTDLPGKERLAIRQMFRSVVEEIVETYDSGRVLVTHPLFERLGFTDAAVATVCEKGILVLTADLDLQLALQRRGADALNFNHVRPLA